MHMDPAACQVSHFCVLPHIRRLEGLTAVVQESRGNFSSFALGRCLGVGSEGTRSLE